MAAAHDVSICRTCSTLLGRGNKTGYCRRHVSAHNLSQPHIRAAQRAGIARKHATDPEFLDGLRARARRLADDPVINAKRTQHFKEGRFWELGTIAARAPEVRARAGRKISATKLAWCPPHLRAEYLHLIRNKRIPAAEARALIEDQNEVEMRRWRASLPDGLRRAG
jgi:hypothetical protein